MPSPGRGRLNCFATGAHQCGSGRKGKVSPPKCIFLLRIVKQKFSHGLRNYTVSTIAVVPYHAIQYNSNVFLGDIPHPDGASSKIGMLAYKNQPLAPRRTGKYFLRLGTSVKYLMYPNICGCGSTGHSLYSSASIAEEDL